MKIFVYCRAAVYIALIMLIVMSASNAAKEPVTQADCLIEYAKICGNVALTEPSIRSCITTNQRRFTPLCLEIAKEMIR